MERRLQPAEQGGFGVITSILPASPLTLEVEMKTDEAPSLTTSFPGTTGWPPSRCPHLQSCCSWLAGY